MRIVLPVRVKRRHPAWTMRDHPAAAQPGPMSFATTVAQDDFEEMG
jgi:hypothetical protein